MKLNSPNLTKHLIEERRQLSNENNENFNAKNELSLSSQDDLTLHGSIKSSVKYNVKPTENQKNYLINYCKLENLLRAQNKKINEQKLVL